MNRELKLNLIKFYVFSFIDYFTFLTPYFILYLKNDLNFNYTLIATFTIGYTISLLLFEVPSGHIADRIGRKNSILIGVFLQVLTLFIICFAKSPTMIIISAIIEGIARSFISGADSAMLYDWLADKGMPTKYKKFHGKALFFTEIGIIISALLGSFIIGFGIKAILYATFFTKLLLFIPASLYVEPIKHKKHEMELSDNISFLFHTIKKTLKNKKLLLLFIYSGIVIGFTNVIFIFYQPYLFETGIPIKFNGIIFAIFSIFTAFGAHQAHDIEKKLGIKRMLIIMPLFLFISYIFSGLFFIWFGFIFFFFREVIRGLSMPVIQDYTNKLIVSSSIRATILSILNLVIGIIFTILSIFFGILTDIFNIKTSLIVGGILLLIFTIYCLIFVDDDIFKAHSL